MISSRFCIFIYFIVINDNSLALKLLTFKMILLNMCFINYIDILYLITIIVVYTNIII